MTLKPRLLVSLFVLATFIAALCPTTHSQNLIDAGDEPLVLDQPTPDVFSADYVFSFDPVSDAVSDPRASPSPDQVPGGIEWGGLMRDSIRFLLVEHGYRAAVQEKTRAGLTGPFFHDYAASVANIHGWGDGDGILTNYAAHPMEGAVAGFLEIAHDPRYRDATFDMSGHYWKSRLRATAFAAAYSLQFEIGPLSEASIGNVQQNPKARGVVDWVITPTAGLAWMVAEDFVDKRYISRWENETKSYRKRAMVRVFLNPTRTFANLMEFKMPWHRDTRLGITQF